MELSPEVVALAEYVQTVRRELHRIPELAKQENKTQQFLLAELRGMGYKPRLVGTGLTVDIKGQAAKKGIVAFRADMDGLPIREAESDCPFRSTHEGLMHACGHDGHMAMLLGAARLLKAKPPKYNVRLIFQPAEENEGGAESMIAAGAIDGVDEIYGLHVAPYYDIGTIATRDGALFAGAVDSQITFYGKKGHCADPQKSDALRAAVRFYSEADALIKQYDGRALLHMGKMQGGVSSNVVADEAVQYWTMRYFRDEDKEALTLAIAHALNRVNDECGTDHRFVVTSYYPPLVNSKYAVMVAGNSYPVIEAEARYTAEDFAYYCALTNGCFAWLGVRDDKHTSGLHTAEFGFDERALLYGVEYYKRLAY